MAERIRIPRGNFGQKDEIFYTAEEIDNILFSRNRLNARAFGNANVFGSFTDTSEQGIGKVIGVTTEAIDGQTVSSIEVEIYTMVEQGLDYFLYNSNTEKVYAIVPLSDLNVGTGTLLVEETLITAPIGSLIIKQAGQSAADDRRFRERIVDLDASLTTLNDTVLPQLETNLNTLEGYLEDPSTMPAGWKFFEGILTDDIWADTGVFMTAWADNVFANTVMTDRVTANIIDVDDLAANTAFIINLLTQELTLGSGTGTSPYEGGIIKANFDGSISTSNLILSAGTSGFAIDWGGTVVLNDAVVRGTIYVTGGDAATESYADSVAQTAEDNAANYTENNLDSAANQLGYASYDSWVTGAAANSTLIDGGFIRTTLLQADDILSQNITWTGILQNTVGTTDIILAGENLDTLRVDGSQLLIGQSGTGTSSRPIVEARADNNNWVRMVGRKTGDASTRFFEVSSGGNIVFYVDDSGATYGGTGVPAILDDLTVNGILTMGSGAEITNTGDDYLIDPNGMIFKGAGGKLLNPERRVEWTPLSDLSGASGDSLNWFIVTQFSTPNSMYFGTSTAGMELRDGGDLYVDGFLSKSSGSFRIPHPNPELTRTKELWHSFVESPTAGDNIYRFTINTENKKGIVHLPDYFKFLNKNPQAWVDGEGTSTNYRFEDEYFTFNVNKDGIYNVLIIATRKDKTAKKYWKGEVRDKR